MSRIHQAAKSFMEEAQDDVAAAKRLARERVAGDAELARQLWEYGIDKLIEDVWRSGRADHWHAVQTGGRVGSAVPIPAMRGFVLQKGETSTPSAALMAGLRQELTGLHAYQMPDGTLLGNWRKRELREHAKREIAKARSGLRNNYWLLSVAEALKRDTDTVKDALTHADLERLAKHQLEVKAS